MALKLTKSEALERIKRSGELRELVAALANAYLEEARDNLEFCSNDTAGMYRAQGRAEVARHIYDALTRNN